MNWFLTRDRNKTVTQSSRLRSKQIETVLSNHNDASPNLMLNVYSRMWLYAYNSRMFREYRVGVVA